MDPTPSTLLKFEQLRLRGMHRAYTTCQETGMLQRATPAELVAHLVDVEWDDRHNRTIDRLTKEARFRYTVEFEDIDFNATRGLDRQLIMALSDCQWIRQHQDIIITGKTGTGKSFLATALGRQACRFGMKTGYYQCSKLFAQLRLCHADGTYLKQLAKIEKLDLLILDDFGLSRLDGASRLSLMEIAEDRHGRKSTVVVTQLPVNQWHEIIGDPTLADAICDRLVHGSQRLALKGESMRKVKAEKTS